MFFIADIRAQESRAKCRDIFTSIEGGVVTVATVVMVVCCEHSRKNRIPMGWWMDQVQ